MMYNNVILRGNNYFLTVKINLSLYPFNSFGSISEELLFKSYYFLSQSITNTKIKHDFQIC